MSINVEMRFFKCEKTSDTIGYLVNEGAPDDGGHVIRSIPDFKSMTRNSTPQTREIFIVDTIQEAQVLAMLKRKEVNARIYFNEITDKESRKIYAVNLVQGAGYYDYGIPAITDLRKHGDFLSLVGDFPDYEIDIRILDYKTDVDILNSDLQPIKFPFLVDDAAESNISPA